MNRNLFSRVVALGAAATTLGITPSAWADPNCLAASSVVLASEIYEVTTTQNDTSAVSLHRVSLVYVADNDYRLEVWVLPPGSTDAPDQWACLSSFKSGARFSSWLADTPAPTVNIVTPSTTATAADFVQVGLMDGAVTMGPLQVFEGDPLQMADGIVEDSVGIDANDGLHSIAVDGASVTAAVVPVPTTGCASNRGWAVATQGTLQAVTCRDHIIFLNQGAVLPLGPVAVDGHGQTADLDFLGGSKIAAEWIGDRKLAFVRGGHFSLLLGVIELAPDLTLSSNTTVLVATPGTVTDDLMIVKQTRDGVEVLDVLARQYPGLSLLTAIPNIVEGGALAATNPPSIDLPYCVQAVAPPSTFAGRVDDLVVFDSKPPTSSCEDPGSFNVSFARPAMPSPGSYELVDALADTALVSRFEDGNQEFHVRSYGDKLFAIPANWVP